MSQLASNGGSQALEAGAAGDVAVAVVWKWSMSSMMMTAHGENMHFAARGSMP